MSDSGYSCCGKSCCGSNPTEDELDRRDFMKAAASGFSVAALLSSTTADAAPEDRERWNATLLDRGTTRIHRGEELTHIAMPLGGIGAGQVYLRGSGTLSPWQNFNNFNSNANVNASAFLIRTKSDGAEVTRALQLEKHGDVPGVQSIEFSGEYPFAWLSYVDDALPLSVRMEAFSPFIPLNTKDSGLPVILFRFTLRNTSSAPLEAEIKSLLTNLIGWDGYAALPDSLKHSEFGGNVNRIEERPNALVLSCGSVEGVAHAMSLPVHLYTNDNDAAYHMRHCGNLKVHYGRPFPTPKEAQGGDVYWIQDTHGRLSEGEFDSLLDKIAAGATAVIICDEHSLIHEALNKRKPEAIDTVFDDFESGTYANWRKDGDAFGDAPATGTLPGQQKVSGWQGTHFVNTFMNGDGPVGSLKSQPFTITRRYIHFLVGGGNHPNETCINLVIDGKVVASDRGQNTEQLRPMRWDVSSHLGSTATIEIIDQNSGGWGHVLIDDIRFSDSPRTRIVDPSVVQKIREALPFRAWSTKPFSGEPKLPDSNESAVALPNKLTKLKPAWTARGLRLKSNAEVLLRPKGRVPLIIRGKHGAGTLIICNGALEQFYAGNDRKALIGDLLARATGIAHTPQTGLATTSPLFGTMAMALLHSYGVTATGSVDESGGREPNTPTPPGETVRGYVRGACALQPNEVRTLTFALAWHLPNRTRDDAYGWGPPRYQYDHRLGNQYNNWFKSAVDVIDYIASDERRLRDETETFHTTFHNSTLPQYLLDAVSANASIVRSPIYVWLEDGTVGGFEGSDRCCPMNCTHVYNYAMSAAFLFPQLERNVRETDLLVQMHPTEHYIPHRTVLPLSLPRLGRNIGGPEHPALDGELGTILKTYREWLACGDRAWLDKVYSRVRLLMLYIMREHDTDNDGVIKGEQPNTYDTHLFGSNTFIGTLYLAALRAAEEMAKLQGDTESAKTFRDRFELGREGYDKTCWNGEYYFNVFDAPNATPDIYNSNNCYGPGCFSDQLLGQWWAHVLGLGYVLPEARVKSALQAIHRYNWRADLTDHKHTQRVFARENEKGLLTGTWPQGGRPERPILYCDEVWTGIEYQVAATMLYEGMVTEAMQIVRGARERYTGSQRNPWSEIECGGHYARAMSSYALLHAAAGFVFNAGEMTLTMAPRVTPENFKGFCTVAQGWGSLSQQRDAHTQRNAVNIRHGVLTLRDVVVATPEHRGKPAHVTVNVGNHRIRRMSARYANGRCTIHFPAALELATGKRLSIELRWA